MSDENIEDPRRRIQRAEVELWDRQQRVDYLAARGWRQSGRSRWHHKGHGIDASLLSAAVWQLNADQERSNS